jgi:hypothetical protein
MTKKRGHQSPAQRMAEVLCYRPKPASRSTVHRYYDKWRAQQSLEPRCDLEECYFHSQPLVWREKPLPLILDHKNGNSRDNSPSNLRYLCPNCESQLETRGGRNRGRVELAEEGKFVLRERSGRRDYFLFPKPGHYAVTGYAPTIKIGTADSPK